MFESNNTKCQKTLTMLFTGSRLGPLLQWRRRGTTSSSVIDLVGSERFRDTCVPRPLLLCLVR
jgi:hypothetical protein